MYKKIKKIIRIILEALILLFACVACYYDFMNGRIIWGIIMVVSITLWIIIDIIKVISIIKYKNDNTKQSLNNYGKYELGSCPRCQKTDLIVAANKVICKSCSNWSWAGDAYNSSWFKEVDWGEKNA